MLPTPSIAQTSLLARELFSRHFSCEPSTLAIAPGRVNLIGEHVDYNEGIVLPFAIGLHTVVALRTQNTNRVRVISQLEPTVTEFSLSQLTTEVWQAWPRYLQGVLRLLEKRLSIVPRGYDIAVASSLPIGAGLSSSAALCVALSSAILQTAPGRGVDSGSLRLSLWEQAQLCQQVEHQFAGVPCGLMDQLAVLAGRSNQLLAIDFRGPQLESIPWPDPELGCLLIHSGVQHELATGEYAERRAACEAASAKLGIPSLRDASLEFLEARQQELTPTEFRRARHVSTEIDRTRQAIAACRNNDPVSLGKLLDASHDSLRDDYQVSCPELDFLVTGVRRFPGVLGARLTGGGFGGSLIALLPITQLPQDQLQCLLEAYASRFGVEPRWMLCRPSAGALELNAAH